MRKILSILSLFTVFTCLMPSLPEVSAVQAQTTYAEWSPTDKIAQWSLTNGNLTASITNYGTGIVRANMGKSSGKWYWELTYVSQNSGQPHVGVANVTASLTEVLGLNANGWAYLTYLGDKMTNGWGNLASYGGAVSVGDVVGVALDMDAGTLTMYLNGVSQGVMYSGLTGTLYPALGNQNGYQQSWTANFGATAFAFSVPGGFNSGLYTTSGNANPTADAGSDQNITLPTSTATLSASGSTDSDGTIAAYLWEKISGPAGGTIASPAAVSTNIASLQAGVYVYRVTVTDDDGATATDNVQITVNVAGNQPPTATAGTDQNITLPTSSTSLSGGGSDPDGTIASRLWTKVSGPAGGVIGTPTTNATTITNLQAGTYVFRFTVTDNNGATASDDVSIIVAAAGSTVFYVAKTGNNSTGDGSFASPWLTVLHAVQNVTTAGRTIHVMPGTYTETAVLQLAVGVSLEGEGAANTIIRSTVTADWTPLLELYSGTSNTQGNQRISYLRFDGQNLATFWGVQIQGRGAVEMDHCTVENFKDRGVIFGGHTDEGASAAPSAYATGNLFHDNIINNSGAYNTANGIYGRGNLNIGGQDGMLVYNNTITQNQRPNGFNGYPIKYNNGGYNRNVKIYNNTIVKIPYGGSYLGENGWDFAIELWETEGGVEIYNNDIQGGGIDVDRMADEIGAGYSVWIHHNNIYNTVNNNNFESGIILENYGGLAADVICEYNNIWNKTVAFNFTQRNGGSMRNIRVNNNLCYGLGRLADGNDGFAVIWGSDPPTGGTVKTVYIRNNTFVAYPGRAPWYGIKRNSTLAFDSIYIQNNIIQGFLSNGIEIASVNRIWTQNNNLYLNGNANDPVISATNPVTSGNTKVNPLFVNPSTGNYTLQAGSPMIDAGINVGFPYNGTAPDKGYSETGVPSQNYIQWDTPLDTDYELVNSNKGIRSTGASSYNVLKGTASSVQTISSGESVVFDAISVNNFFMVGLSTYKPVSKIYDDVQGEDSVTFGILMAINDSVQAYEAGYVQGSRVRLGAGSLVRINYTGTTIRYQLSTNGGLNYTTFYTSSTPALGSYYVIFHSPSNGAGPNNIFKEGVQVNQPPIVSAGADLSVTLPISSTTLTGVTSDPDGTIATTLWTKTSGPSGGSLLTPGNDTTQVSGLTVGTYVYRLTVVDNSGASTSDDVTVVVNSADPNGSVPVAPAIIPFSDPEVESHGRGMEQWMDQNYVKPVEALPQTTRKDVYWRMTWRGLETAFNVFNWAALDALINDAIDKGQPFSFGIMCTAGNSGTDFPTGLPPVTAGGGFMNYPLYLHNQMQADGGNNTDWISPLNGEWVPNYNNAYFLARTKNLYDSVYNHFSTKSYNGVAYKDVINYIDIRHYGSWGEWNESSHITNQASYPTDRQPTVASLDSIIAYITPTWLPWKAVLPVAVFDAQWLQNTWIPPAVTYFALTRRTARGPLGWRRDQWGEADGASLYIHNWTDQNTRTFGGIVFRDTIMVRWKEAPVVGEPPGRATGDVPDLKNLPKEVKFYNAASFGNGNMHTVPIYTPANLSAGTKDSVRMASKLAGYRIQMEGGLISSAVETGGVITLRINWRNAGLTPVYDPYRLDLEIRNGVGSVIKKDTLDFRVHLFQPSASVTESVDQIYIPVNTTPGNYSVYLIFRDSLGYRTPLALANTGRQADGSYLISNNLTITSSVANVSPSVSINNPFGNTVTLPVAIDTLIASASDPDGTISTYAWSKVSGPAGGTIESPTASSTRVTGLTEGTYTYQVVVTDDDGGTGIAFTTLTVLPVPPSNNILPVVTAGRSAATITSSVRVFGSATDADGTIASYQWTQLSGPSVCSFSTPTATATDISNILADGLYVFEFAATDNLGGVSRVTLRIQKSQGNKIIIYK